MRKTKEILRLAQETELTNRQIARSVKVSPTTVADCISRAEAAGLVWPFDVRDMDEGRIEELLYPEERTPTRPLPDMKHVHTELSRKGVTLALLWQEYAEAHPGEAYSYAQFTRHYRSWVSKLEVPMRQVHKAGEKLFTDFAGHTIPIVDAATGEITDAEVFVATHGFSSYTYAEAVASQGLSNWIAAHIRAFAFFGGTPEILRQSEERGHASVPLRTRRQPDVCRHGLPLPLRGDPGESQEAARQGQGRERRSAGGALGDRSLERPGLPHPVRG